jgi:hypothetical protein
MFLHLHGVCEKNKLKDERPTSNVEHRIMMSLRYLNYLKIE